MDRINLEQRITENMKSIFGFALTRLGNVAEAEDLASDILYEILRSADKLRDESRFFAFMWRIAENTYYDYIRKKQKHAMHTEELDENAVDESEDVLCVLIRDEELHLLRRELSLLSKQYRDTTVLYYIQGFSCFEIAEKLKISTEMVKYYLFRARKMIREGMNMERLFGEKSYAPGGFEIDYWGPADFHPNEYRDFQRRKIKGNILLAAYYSPMTMQEISIELGVAMPYLEDEINLLSERGYLVCKNGKYLTNIPIFTPECTEQIDRKLKDLTAENAEKFVAVADTFTEQFGDRFANENLVRWQKVLMCMHFSLLESERVLKSQYGESTDNGLGVIWGRSFAMPREDALPQGIQGIYNGAAARDGRGSVIAMNFRQTLHAQHFEYCMTDPMVATAFGAYSCLGSEWQDILKKHGYVKDGKPNFAIWTMNEYEEMRKILSECTALALELSRKTSDIAAEITADLAPVHIRRTAEHVGAVVYRFGMIDNLVNALYDMGWLKSVDDTEKPAVCVVKN